jgi:hypothetical protein
MYTAIFVLITAIAVIYAIDRRYKTREMKRIVEETENEHRRWYRASMNLARELNALGRNDLVMKALKDIDKDPLGDVKVPDFLPEDL